MPESIDAAGGVGRAPEPATPEPGAPPGGKGGKEGAPLDVSCSRQFTSWLAEQRASLAFTTYQAAKLFFVGLQPNGKLSLYKRTLPRCMGMTAHGNSIYVSSLFQLWRFENILDPGKPHDG